MSTLRKWLATLTVAASGACGAVTTDWVNGPGGVSIATDAASNVYTVRWDYAPGGDIFLAKRNASGTLQWEVNFDNTDPTKHEVATWVGADGAGNALVAGTVRSSYSSPVNANSILMKFDAQGRLLWRKVYDATFDGSSTRKLLTDAQNNVYVLGLGRGPLGMVTTVRKFAPDGSTLWSWFDSVGIGAPLNFKWTPDNGLLIAARGISGSVNGFAKIDAQGRTVWSHAPVSSLTAGDSAGDAHGNTYLVNGEYVFNGGSLLRKLSPAGLLLWERQHPMAAMRIEVGSDGAPVVSGFPNAGTAGAAFAKFDSAGGLLWQNLDADGPSFALLLHAQMVLDGVGNAYLAAGTLGAMAVNKINANGSTAWVATASYGTTHGLALGADGAVYAVGGETVRFLEDATPAPPPPPPPWPTTSDLALTVSDAPDPVRKNELLVYTLVVRNHGSAVATGVVLTNVLPASVRWLETTPSQGSCAGKDTVRCTLGTLAVGAQTTVTIAVRPRSSGSLTNQATVRATELDPAVGNNSVTTLTTVGR